MSSVRITTRYGSRTASGGGGGVSGGGGAGGGVDNFSKYFEVVNEGTAEELIKAKFPLHSINDIVAFSNGTGGGAAPSIPLATYATVGVVKVDPSTMTVDANGMIAVKGDLFNLSNYYDKTDSDSRYLAAGALAGYATESYVNGKVTALVNSAPATLDTLNELAAALGGDANFATTTATAMGNRLRVDIATQGLSEAQKANGRANLGLGTAATSAASAFAAATHSHTKSQITDFPSSMPASDVYAWAKAATKPSYTFSEIGTKPTTVSGYGITDAVKCQDATTHPAQTIFGDIIVKGKIYSSDDIIAFSDGTGGGTAPSIPLATYTTTGVVKVDPSTMTVDDAGMIAVKGDLFNLSNYYTKEVSDGRFAAVSHTHTISQIADIANASVASAAKLTTARTIALTGGVAGSGSFDGSGNLSIATNLRALVAADIPSLDWAKITTGKPTTLGGYGITDAIKNTGGTIAGDLTITGNLYLQQDSKYIVTEKVYSENDFITLRYNNPSLLAAGAYTGFEAKKVFADGTDGYLVFGNDGMAKVGKQASLQMLATREDAPTDGAIQYYSAANKRLTSGVLATDLWHKANLNRSDKDFTARNITAGGNVDLTGLDSSLFIGRTTGTDTNKYATRLKLGNARHTGSDAWYFGVDDNDDGSFLRIGYDTTNSAIRFKHDKTALFGGDIKSWGETGSGFTATGWKITIDGDANVKNCIVRNDLSVKKTKLYGPDGNVKWTAQLSATGDYLEFYNASGVMAMRLSQAGKLQVRDDVEAFSNFN